MAIFPTTMPKRALSVTPYVHPKHRYALRNREWQRAKWVNLVDDLKFHVSSWLSSQDRGRMATCCWSDYQVFTAPDAWSTWNVQGHLFVHGDTERRVRRLRSKCTQYSSEYPPTWIDASALPLVTRLRVQRSMILINIKNLMPQLTHLDVCVWYDTFEPNPHACDQLAEMPALEHLTLASSDVLPVIGAPNLRYLFFYCNAIHDISAVSNLTNLETLIISGQKQGSKWHQMSEPKWYYADRRRKKLSDLTPLSGLTNLTHLELEHTEVVDLRPLATLVKMKSLALRGCKFTSLKGLETMRLEKLDLRWNNKLENVDTLVYFHFSLRELRLGFSYIPSIGYIVLKYIPALEVLDLNRAFHLRDNMEWTTKMPKLHTLFLGHIYHNRPSLKPLCEMPSLKHVYMPGYNRSFNVPYGDGSTWDTRVLRDHPTIQLHEDACFTN